MTAILVDASIFTPLRGHVADGVKVRFRDQKILQIKSTMRGWTLQDETGCQHIQPTNDAMVLTGEIVRIDNACDSIGSPAH